MMKQILTCFLVAICLVIASSAFAQNDFNSFKMDSLAKMLSTEKTAKDSILILQQMVDFVPIRQGETNNYPDRTKLLLELNSREKLIDPVPYQLIQDGNNLWNQKQYAKALKNLQLAVEDFDKQHKNIMPLLMSVRLLYNLLDDQDARLAYYQKQLNYYLVNGPFENTAPCYHAIAYFYFIKGADNQAISYYFEAADIFKKIDPHYYVNAMVVVGLTYNNWGNFDKAGYYLNYIIPIAKKIKDENALGEAYYGLAYTAFVKKNYSDALKLIDEGFATTHIISQRIATYFAFKANIYLAMGQPSLALPQMERAKKLSDSASYKTINNFGDMEIDYDDYLYYQLKGDHKKAEQSLLTALKKVTDEKGVEMELKYLKELGAFYAQQNKPMLSAKYFQRFVKLTDEQELSLNQFKISQYEIDQNDKTQRENITRLKQEKVLQGYQLSQRNNLLWGALLVVLLISGLLVFIYKQLQANKKTLSSLRKTQRQLIQSEKMASLGELTAGIAHEIQNPLNFVNNFSDVNREMLQELKAESAKPKTERDEQLEIELINDLMENETKINHHGKRADFIVKGMLLHSRTSTGEKQLTNINTMADEFFKLSYHGLRAKDKNFNAELATHFDKNLPEVNVAHQDIGRVLLNLFNNAFYAVNQKQKTAGADYKPEVSVSTSLEKNNFVIKVRDNGNGIPDAIKDKIMQPFFTTKPTGEGTGLGLSLSYDIVVKGHGGSITVNSKKDEGAEFIVQLPIA
jgi:two-component system NtrC family sensor kinase